MRPIVKVVCLQARLAVQAGAFDEALDWIGTGFTMARHATEGPSMIESLVGISLTTTMLKPLEDMIVAPGSPNLFWALAGRPRPFIEMSAGIENERLFVENQIPELRELNSEPWSVEKARAFTASVEQRLTRLMGDAGGKSALARSPLESWSQSLGVASLVAQVYPEAKRALIAQGRRAHWVEAMPAVQVVMLHTLELYRQLRDDEFKWARLPYFQSYRAMNEQFRRTVACTSNNLLLKVFVSLVPAVQPSRMAHVLLERKLDAIQCIEAIRLYAADHGRLPAGFDQLTESPPPSDAATGLPFGYRLDGDRALLSAPPVPGGPDVPDYRIQ
jgi:hypothetical protein